jgi:UDP-glucose-4-epimerase GalE
VIHFAGLKAVGESVQLPLEYYRNNLTSTLNLLLSMQKHGVERFVFSSSATVYGDPVSVPIREDFALSATNPYGRTKLMIEEILRDVSLASPNFASVFCATSTPSARISPPDRRRPERNSNNLMPYIAQVAVGKLPALRVFGNDYPTHDGTGVRDYIHVVDLAKGHVAALKKLETGSGVYTYNLGTGVGYSVLDVLHAFEKACVRRCVMRLSVAERETSPPVTPIRKRRQASSAGVRNSALSGCVRTRGAGNRRIRTVRQLIRAQFLSFLAISLKRMPGIPVVLYNRIEEIADSLNDKQRSRITRAINAD